MTSNRMNYCESMSRTPALDTRRLILKPGLFEMLSEKHFNICESVKSVPVTPPLTNFVSNSVWEQSSFMENWWVIRKYNCFITHRQSPHRHILSLESKAFAWHAGRSYLRPLRRQASSIANPLGFLTFAHGLGASLTFVTCYIQCTTADGGWGAGERVMMSNYYAR